jgi:hypothetical protein
VPLEDHGGELAAGAVNISYGAASGLHNLADAFHTQSTAGISGDVEDSDDLQQSGLVRVGRGPAATARLASQLERRRARFFAFRDSSSVS